MRSFGFLYVAAAGALLVACGGSSPPAEQPEMTPAAPAADASAMPEKPPIEGSAGGHTMPDGSTMPGDMKDK